MCPTVRFVFENNQQSPDWKTFAAELLLIPTPIAARFDIDEKSLRPFHFEASFVRVFGSYVPPHLYYDSTPQKVLNVPC
jgi:hypothetical protein